MHKYCIDKNARSDQISKIESILRKNGYTIGGKYKYQFNSGSFTSYDGSDNNRKYCYHTISW